MHTMTQLSLEKSDSFIFEVAPRMDRAGSEHPLSKRITRAATRAGSELRGLG